MNKLIQKISEKFGIRSLRTKNIVRHITASFFYKGFAILANFLLVPLTIDFLDTENYGIWLTLSAFIAWFSFFDIGLGNGLRNKLTEAKAVGDLKLARSYISSAYYTIAGISLILFLVFSVLNSFIDWTIIFNTSENLKDDLNLLMPLIVGFFCIQLVVNLITNIYLADQNHSIQVKVHFLTQVVSLMVIWVLTKTTEGSLLLYGIIFSALPVAVLIILNLKAFSKKFIHLKPALLLWNRHHLKDIMGIGFDFFIIQIAGIIIFSTDNFIISKLFSPEEVVPYNIAFKYFSIVSMGFTLIVVPYWSSFSEAYIKKEFEWIKTSIRNIVKIWFVIPFLLLIMIFMSQWFYGVWIGDKVNIPHNLSLSMALFVLIFTFNLIFVFFINGVGKIRLQLIISIVSVFINIPLSIFFAKNLNFGLSGVILASCISIGASAVLSPIQYHRIINFKAKGIWNK